MRACFHERRRQCKDVATTAGARSVSLDRLVDRDRVDQIDLRRYEIRHERCYFNVQSKADAKSTARNRQLESGKKTEKLKSKKNW